MHKKRRGARRLLAGAVCAVLLPGFSAAALPGYTKGRLNLVTEPDDMARMTAYITYYKDGKAAGYDGMTWVEGRRGQALLLDGKTEFLALGHSQLKTNRFSFAAWINWLGAPEGEPEEAQLGQRLFTMSRGDSRWLSFSPHERDAAKSRDGGSLDGLYLDYYFGGGNGQGTRLEQFNAARDGITYALPKNEWHHVAVVSDEQTMKVYIDGRLWFDDILMNSMVEMQALTFKLGGGLTGGLLHAMLDDVGLYEIALTQEQIALLAAGMDPLEENAGPPPSREPYRPTAPAPTAPPSSGAEQDTGEGFRMPGVVLGVTGGLAALVAGLSVLLSIRGKKENSAPRGKGGGRE